MDPRTDTIRYVGKADLPFRRMRRHIKDGRDGKTDHKNRWINDVLAEGLYPILLPLEICLQISWEVREQWWVAYYKHLCCDLTNANDGGIGCDISERTRQKMREAKLGKSPHNKGKSMSAIIREKQRQSALRRWNHMSKTERQRAAEHLKDYNHSHSGWHHTVEARAKISVALLGNQRTLGYKATIETRKKQSEAGKGQIFPEECCARIAAAKQSLGPDQVKEIRRLLWQGNMNQATIARQFKVSPVLISRLKLGKSYKQYNCQIA